MRQLKFATENKYPFSLEGVPEDFKLVEAIAKQHASTMQDLERFYRIGVEAAEKFRSQTTQKRYDSKVAWVVTQSILESKKNIINQP